MSTQSKEVHHLVIKPRSAGTGCGITVSAYYPMSNTALAVYKDGRDEVISCVTDFCKAITCDRCKRFS